MRSFAGTMPFRLLFPMRTRISDLYHAFLHGRTLKIRELGGIEQCKGGVVHQEAYGVPAEPDHVDALRPMEAILFNSTKP